MDSIRKVQYPNNDQDAAISVDLTPEFLDHFLMDIDKDSFARSNYYVHQYHFVIAPKGHTDPIECYDDIRLSFDPKLCQFRMVISNHFLVEPDWCVGSDVVYGFNIQYGISIAFWRQGAG